MCKTKWAGPIALLMIVTLVLAACGPAATPEEKIVTQVIKETVVVEGTPQVVEKQVTAVVKETQIVEVQVTPTPSPVDRTGAWLDMVIVVEEPSSDAGVARVEAGELDMYAYAVSKAALFEKVKANPDLAYSMSYGSLNVIMFNPVGPTFPATGKLNPFSVPKIREAVNWLVDRKYIAEELMGGMGVPRLLPVVTAFPDYARYADIARKLEAYYAYNPDKAKEVISQEMETLGATLVDGKWQYDGEPVELIFLIRTEDERRDIGDYIASQLESLGFTVQRDYKTGAEATPIWNQGNPADGLWSLYTGGWVNNWIVRDSGGNFEFYYTPRGYPSPLWMAMTPSAEFAEIADRLNRNDFTSMAERKEMFEKAFELALQDSEELFLVDRRSFTARRQEVIAGYDLASAVSGSTIWAYTLRREGEVGGAMTLGEPSILTEPWNPIAGTNWLYDAMIHRAIADVPAMPDPHTGLRWPQRIEKSEVFVKEGLPVEKTLDWVSLQFVPENQVPADAWVDWDAAAQKFVTVGEKYPDGLTANLKVVTYYPKDLFERKWHDGSPMSVADFVMAMIMAFDQGKPESAIYDASAVPALESFQSHFKGTRIVSTDPLTIEYYSDQIQLDAEIAAHGGAVYPTWFPTYPFGSGAWHNIALGILAETNNETTFSSAKADELGVDWMSYIAGPTVAILEKYLGQAVEQSYIPYAPTLGQYITAEETAARYANLDDWYGRKGHFWIGTGPYYLEKAFPIEGTVILKRNPDYPDPADKWSGFGEPKIAEVEIDGPARVTINSEAAYDVIVTFYDEPYPVAEIIEVKYLVFDAKGELAFSGQAEAVEDGLWQIKFSPDQTAKLAEGSNRLEVAVVSKRVSIPTFAESVFAAAP